MSIAQSNYFIICFKSDKKYVLRQLALMATMCGRIRNIYIKKYMIMYNTQLCMYIVHVQGVYKFILDILQHKHQKNTNQAIKQNYT